MHQAYQTCKTFLKFRPERELDFWIFILWKPDKTRSVSHKPRPKHMSRLVPALLVTPFKKHEFPGACSAFCILQEIERFLLCKTEMELDGCLPHTLSQISAIERIFSIGMGYLHWQFICTFHKLNSSLALNEWSCVICWSRKKENLLLSEYST